MNGNYKTISVKLENNLNNKEKEFIKNFNSEFSPDDIKFEYENNQLRANFKAVDIISFKNIFEEKSNKYDLKENRNITKSFKDVMKQIEDIGSYGLKGKKRIFVDYNKERKVKNRITKEKARGPFYYAKKHSFKKESNELPYKFMNKIICEDSKTVLKELPDNCIDLVFTSPPYNFGLNYGNSKDEYDWEEYFNKLFSIFDECIRVLKYGGRIVVNTQPLFSDYIPSHHIISNFFMKKNLIWKGEILWEKNNYNCKYTAWGSWKSPSSPYLKYTWEFMEVFSKGNLKKQGDSENIDITGDEFKKWVTAKWSIAPERNMKKFDHPAMFPEELARRVLKLFSFRNDIILDPFNGVGTTTYVAKITGRKYLGIDVSKDYCNAAKKRIQEILL